MNKVITDGLDLMPPPFADGLDQWSRTDGTPGSASYAGAANAVLVPADQDFGDCLEFQKIEDVERIRFKGETPIQPGTYLRISFRLKVVSGSIPDARISAFAADATGAEVPGLVVTGPVVTPAGYGQIVTVTAIVGSGARQGVDMPWGIAPGYGHFGLELTGANGGILRIENMVIEDVTAVFHRELMDWVDVVDYGALGDGVTDDARAFEAADAAAAGRGIVVPDGTFFLGDHVSITTDIRFEGRITMPADKRLALTRNFDLNAYYDAFGDEVLAFEKAIQALFNFSDHESLDLCGRRIETDRPIDIHAAIGNQDTFAIRKVIRNGQFEAFASNAFDTVTATARGTYDPDDKFTLSAVDNIAQVQPGALVTGTGVGREVYVTAVNVAAQRLTLSQPLYDAAGTQDYTFTRFQYLLDFSGFGRLSKFVVAEVDFRCNDNASGILLAPDGAVFQINDCTFTKPRDRAITSHGIGCQDLHVDRCQFVSTEVNTPVVDRETVGININANDAKIRDTRAVRFKHFMIAGGDGHIFTGNHWFQGDEIDGSPRTAGIVFTKTILRSAMTGNYFDNMTIEWTNEHDAAPDFASEYSFGGLVLTGNLFFAISPPSWFRFLVVRPHGPDHFIQGLTVSHNVFRSVNGNIDRVDAVDTSFAPLNLGRLREITFDANTFHGIDQRTISPVTLEVVQDSAAQHWTCDFAGFLPFGGYTRTVVATALESLADGAGASAFDAPQITPRFGPDESQVRLNFPRALKGTAQITARVDKPT